MVSVRSTSTLGQLIDEIADPLPGGLQGTTRPTHYTIVHDENKFTADQIQQLTHGLSFMYARATKAVSLVPPAYCKQYLKRLINRKRSRSYIL